MTKTLDPTCGKCSGKGRVVHAGKIRGGLQDLSTKRCPKCGGLSLDESLDKECEDLGITREQLRTATNKFYACIGPVARLRGDEGIPPLVVLRLWNSFMAEAMNAKEGENDR